MRWLGLALFAEGPTDYSFLVPLLRREVEDICLKEGIGTIDVGEVIGVRSREGASRADRIVSSAREAREAFHVLFIHADGHGSPQKAYGEQIQPAAQRLTAEVFGDDGAVVAVVPVRETEAWLLADGEALRSAWGTRLSDGELGLPARPVEIEREQDPKRVLDRAYRAAGGRGGPRGGAPGTFSIIGETVSLARVRLLSAFREMEEELEQALRKLEYLMPQ